MGVAQACIERLDGRRAGGIRLVVLSDVPEGKGVSSSAALEVACLYAFASCWDLSFSDGEAAAACQRAENDVAGAPCGIMDQVTVVSGRRDRLLRLICQPATIEGYVAIPDEWRFLGIDSGIRHAVTGADYGTVRTAAFMGYRILVERLGLGADVHAGRARVDDSRLRGYLANMTPEEFEHDHLRHIPERLDGASFLARYGGITDPVTRVDPGRTYAVRTATAHPIHEHARVRQFASLLDARPATEQAAIEMGRLMRASHDSYSACGLGSDGTDRLVQLVEEQGPARGLYGGKITGGGSGGTVAVLARADAREAVRDVSRRYTEETGRRAEVFDGSSPGAAATGVLVAQVPRG
jgi:L-arabinokinase